MTLEAHQPDGIPAHASQRTGTAIAQKLGAFFLGVIAIMPIFLVMADQNLGSLAMGGTTVLIVVSVALETVRTLESEMMMRHHKGFLE